MVQMAYSNGITGDSASLAVCGNVERREITVEVIVHDSNAKTFEKRIFPADQFGEAIDFYDAAVKKMDLPKSTIINTAPISDEKI